MNTRILKVIALIIRAIAIFVFGMAYGTHKTNKFFEEVMNDYSDLVDKQYQHIKETAMFMDSLNTELKKLIE